MDPAIVERFENWEALGLWSDLDDVLAADDAICGEGWNEVAVPSSCG